eukprot:scaffold7629_cov36-Tisochrysis_lutea.AAC.2
MSGMCLAALITTYRRACAHHPTALLSASGVLGCFISVLVCLPPCLSLMSEPHVHDPLGPHQGAIHLKPGLGHALTDLEPLFWPVITADAAIAIGWLVFITLLAPRYISGTEIALVLLLGARSQATAAVIFRTAPCFRGVHLSSSGR